MIKFFSNKITWSHPIYESFTKYREKLYYPAAGASKDNSTLALSLKLILLTACNLLALLSPINTQ